MTWTLKKIEETPEGLRPMTREIMSNDEGVQIEPWGASMAGYRTFFKYSHGEIAIEFHARRSPENWVDYDPTGKTRANFALGPVCEVWIDDRRMRFGGRPLSADEENKIKANITEFLTVAFQGCRVAVAPYAERVEFF